MHLENVETKSGRNIMQSLTFAVCVPTDAVSLILSWDVMGALFVSYIHALCSLQARMFLKVQVLIVNIQ